jgi:hypothetical protein
VSILITALTFPELGPSRHQGREASLDLPIHMLVTLELHLDERQAEVLAVDLWGEKEGGSPPRGIVQVTRTVLVTDGFGVLAFVGGEEDR